MSKLKFFGVLIFLFARLRPILSDCRSFGVDSCSYEDDGVLETVKDITEETCQMYCDIIYGGKCQFFLHDKKQKICQLMKQSYSTFKQTCTKVSGPKDFSIDDCKAETDPCKDFLEGYCQFQGSLLENFEDILNVEICQQSCQLIDMCQHFLYDFEFQACQLFDSSLRDCDFIMGPPKPQLNGCKGSESTTSTTQPSTSLTTATTTSTTSTTTSSTTTSTSTTTTSSTTTSTSTSTTTKSTSTTTTSTSSTTTSTTTSFTTITSTTTLTSTSTTTLTSTSTTTTSTTSTTTSTTTSNTITTTTTTSTSTTTTFFQRIELFDGQMNNEGNVFATNPETGVFGPVCDDQWSLNSANVVCRQMGFEGADRFYTASYFGSVPSLFSYDGVVCIGTEDFLDQCQHQDLDDCYSHEGAGVKCY